MENNVQMMELMEKIEENGRRQLRIARLRCMFGFVTALCCVAVVWMVLNVLPQLEDLMIRMQSALDALETVAAELAALDLESMVGDVSELVATGRETLEQTGGVLEELDIETLNKAISDLAAVIEPLARLFR